MGERSENIKMTSDLLLEELMSRYGDSIQRICVVYLLDYQLAEDAVQETFIKAMKSYGSFRGEASEKTWITRIAINCCKNIRRTRWFQHYRNELPDILYSGSNDLSESVVEKKVVFDALSELGELDRELIVMHYYEELSIDEISRIIGKNTNTTRQKLFRARNRIKKLLLEAGYGR